MTKYKACDFFTIRTPLLSITDYISMFSEPLALNTLLKEAFADPILREALAVTSKDLLEAFDNAQLDAVSKSAEQVRSSLLKYFIRLSTRPTPFGLFSGVSIGQFSNVSDITISDMRRHSKRARPDMEWVYGLIKKIEADINIRKKLRVRFNDFTYANGNRIDKPNKTFMQHDTDNDTPNELSTSIRYTEQVKMLENKCVGFQLYSNLLDEIVTQNPSTPINKIEKFLSQLLENEFLISEIRPPLINTDTLEYLVGVLSKIENTEETNAYVTKLRAIQNCIHDYNATAIGEGIDVYNEITSLQSELFHCKNYLQIDMKMHTNNNTLDSYLKDELERFVSAMRKIAPPEKTIAEMRYYIELFLEKYGYSSEVPLLELLDIDKGLGAPAHHRDNVINRVVPQELKTMKEQRLSALLERKLLLALRERQRIIEITDSDIDYICGDEKQNNSNHPMDELQSFELFLLAHPSKTKEENEADYCFTIAPASVSDGFGKSLGRFNDMLSVEEALLQKEGYARQKDLLQEYVIAEIAELPASGRTSNVTMNDNDYDYQVALTTNPCEGKHLLSVRDLYIGFERESSQLYIKSRSLDKKVIVTMTSMMNPTFGSNSLRFMREISVMRRTRVTYGIFGFLSLEYTYFPRITYGRVIIRPETWLVSSDILGLNKKQIKDKNAIENQFALYRQKWDIPRYIFMNESDNRLLLDLDNTAHRGELYHVMKKYSTVAVTLTELGCSFNDYISKNMDGKAFVTEIVVPFFMETDNSKINKNKTENAGQGNVDLPITHSNVSVNRMQINRDELIMLPGNEKWMYYKLYGCSKRQNELISLIYETMENCISNGVVQKYFYIRYSDPEPHLRLRIQPTEKGAAELFHVTSEWLSGLFTDGLISKAVNDSYQRETERYGGPGLIEYAEDYFWRDSVLAMKLITKHRYDEPKPEMDYVGISFIISVLEAFGLSINEQKILLESKSNNNAYRKEFQKNRKMIMYAVDSSLDWFDIRSSIFCPEVYSLISANSQGLKDFAEVIFNFDQRGELTNTISDISMSIIHMFCNRLMGNTAWERKMLALAGHGVHALKGYIEHRQKNQVNLELPESLI